MVRRLSTRWYLTFDRTLWPAKAPGGLWHSLDGSGQHMRHLVGMIVCDVRNPQGQVAGQVLRLVLLRLNVVVAYRIFSLTSGNVEA